MAAPGNPGIARLASLLDLKADDAPGLIAACKESRVDLVVVGPEGPLTAGVGDSLRAAGIAVFGPGAAAARVEGSKAFAKELMHAAGIPTADYRVLGPEDDAEAFARARGPCVVKADGLAAGKGVVVADTGEEAAVAVRELRQQLGGAAHHLVIEDRLDGEEVSVIALCDGRDYALLPPARDHKRLLDADRGPNTGGMGAIAPASILDAEALQEVGRRVIGPALELLAARGTPFIGALYAGLMIGSKGLQVLEFNARFGDPECQVLMPLIDEDLLPWLMGAAEGQLPGKTISHRQGFAVGVVMACEGYPSLPVFGDPISGIEAAEATGARVFQAGTRQEGPRLLTAGGRVLTVCAVGDDRSSAIASAYEAASAITFRGAQRRSDIGRKGQG
jgi:phosphoribosylamine--glycine ligase